MDLALNNLQRLICHKTQQTIKTTHVINAVKILKYIFTNPSARAGYDTKSIFKQSLTGLNSEFSFS